MGGAERLQADVCQLELLLSQLVLQLQDDFSLGLSAFTQPATRDYTWGRRGGGGRGVILRVIPNTLTHTHFIWIEKYTLKGSKRAEV